MNQPLPPRILSLTPMPRPETAAAAAVPIHLHDAAQRAEPADVIHTPLAMPNSSVPASSAPVSGFVLPHIESVSNVRLEEKLREKMDHKTKPLGALGSVHRCGRFAGAADGGVRL